MFLLSLLLTLCFYKLNWGARLQVCSEMYDRVGICYKNEMGLHELPFPVFLSTTLFLNEIIDINWDKNSITIQARLNINWRNPQLGFSRNRTNALEWLIGKYKF